MPYLAERDLPYRQRPDVKAKRKVYNLEHSRRPESIEQRKRYRMQKKYGLAPEEYQELMSRGCEICGGAAEAVDHDHITGVVRGALCLSCNSGIGMLGDSPALLEKALDYLNWR